MRHAQRCVVGCVVCEREEWGSGGGAGSLQTIAVTLFGIVSESSSASVGASAIEAQAVVTVPQPCVPH